MNVTIIAEGDDARQAMKAIKQFLENRFENIG
jgi:phosphotransferase system HPr-like phosphotransfer protein